jgi:hypothetical protein
MTDSDSTSDQASTPDFPVIRTNSKPASPSLRRPVRNYTSIEGHTRFLQFLQFLVVALTVALLVLAVNHTFLLDGIGQGKNDATELVLVSQRSAILFVFQRATGALLGITLVVWIYRAYANLRPLGAVPPRRPGIALALCLIPVVNDFAMFVVLLEIWRGSDPDDVAVDNRSVSSGTESGVLWWFIANLSAQVVYSYLRLQDPAALGSLPGQMMSSNVSILLWALEILRSIVSFWVLGCISNNQAERFHQLQRAAAVAAGKPLRAFSQDH